MVTETQLAELYVALFQRAPTQEELDSWYQVEKDKTLAEAGADMLYAATQVVQSDPTAQQLYPEYANLASGQLTEDQVTQVINAVYQVLFGKDITTDPEGVKGWVQYALQHGADLHSLGETIASITYIGEQFADGTIPTTDPDTLNAALAFKNKVQVALEAAKQIQHFDGDFETLHDLITEVDHTPDSVEKVQEKLQQVAAVKNSLFTTDTDESEEDQATDTEEATETEEGDQTDELATDTDEVAYPTEEESGTEETTGTDTDTDTTTLLLSEEGSSEEGTETEESSDYYISEESAATDTDSTDTTADTGDSTDTTTDTTDTTVA
jgi:hypothetical protein